MCTVSYLPVEGGGYILSSNRDEMPSRSASMVDLTEGPGGQKLIFPRDPKANGSWICLSSSGRLVCLLNGGFEAHRRKPFYRRSRGLVVLDVFGYPGIHDFLEQYPLAGIEPFTMVISDRGRLYELVWDESKRHIRELPARQPHIWSSVTLYSPEFIDKRKALFDNWLARQEAPTLGNILQFHQSGGTGSPENDFVMNRNGIVRTISITSIETKGSYCNFLYKNLLSDEQFEKQFEIEKIPKVVAPD